MKSLLTLFFFAFAYTANAVGTTYVRWGRTKCAEGAVTIYSGYMAGKHWKYGGGGANILCLPRKPDWGMFNPSLNSLTARIYGLEMDILHEGQPFGTKFLNKDMPCAVCKTIRNSAVLMIPGKMRCYPGWHKEYNGYLVAQANEEGRTATEHICADERLESIPGGDSDDNEAVLYPVEIGSCNTLQCPPYVKGRELTCVVCSQ